MMNNPCCIMQPTYMPWSGYFNLISQAKVFVFYDSAEFSKGSWHNRNQILNNGVKQWLTVPVNKSLHAMLKDISIQNVDKWKHKHEMTIKSVYGRAPYFKDLTSIIETLRECEGDKLAQCNISIIKHIAGLLDIESEFKLASVYELKGERSKKILGLLKELGSSDYLSPIGSQDYIEEDNVLSQSGLQVRYQSFEPVNYTQINNSGEFVSHLSILDVLANIGIENTKKYIRGEYYE